MKLYFTARNQIKKIHHEIAIKIMDLIGFDAETDPKDSNSNNNAWLSLRFP